MQGIQTSYRKLFEIIQSKQINGLENYQPVDDCSKRAKNVLTAYWSEPRGCSFIDVYSILLHLVRRYHKLFSSEDVGIKVPIASIPDFNSFAETLSKIPVKKKDEYLIIENIDFTPDWLNGKDIFTEALVERKVSDFVKDYGCDSCDADPCIKDVTGHDKYLSGAQKTAIRNLFQMKNGDTVVINMATGAGKSLIIQAPTLLNLDENHLSIVIVPTTALAIDQEEIFHKMLRQKAEREGISNNYADHKFAYYSELPSDDRQTIKNRIKNGTQLILFTSPESVMTSLIYAVYEAAEQGFLKHFFIDEAHIIHQWGADFRSHFQLLAGLLTDLRRIAQFKTVLLTATMTADCYETIKSLYSQDSRLQLLSGVHLRGEPSYWKCAVQSNYEKFTKLLEAILFAPKPIIIYTTKVVDAESIFKKIKNYGYTRVALFHGKTRDTDRISTIKKWKEDSIDIIIATSAFGMGVDKANVRSIIHACVPETLDRFYQEVGRGGRDKKACVSLQIYNNNEDDSHNDIGIFKSMSSPKLISEELGFERWEVMSTKSESKNGKTIIDLGVRPSRLNYDSDANSEWNMKTLTLMARAGMILFDYEKPELINRINFKTEEEYESAIIDLFDRMTNKIYIKIMDMNNNERDYWEEKFQPKRERELNASVENINNIIKLLEDKLEYSDLFSRLYTLGNVPIPKACGGCPACRNLLQNPEQRFYPPAMLCLSYTAFNSVPNEKTLILISYELKELNRREKKRFYDFLATLIKEHDIRELAAYSPWTEDKLFNTLYTYASDKFLITKNINEFYTGNNFDFETKVPRISIVQNQHQFAEIMSYNFLPKHIIIYPTNIIDLNNDNLLFNLNNNGKYSFLTSKLKELI